MNNPCQACNDHPVCKERQEAVRHLLMEADMIVINFHVNKILSDASDMEKINGHIRHFLQVCDVSPTFPDTKVCLLKELLQISDQVPPADILEMVYRYSEYLRPDPIPPIYISL